MKSIEELGLGTADVAAITPKVIAKTVEEVARGERIFAQFFKENRDLMADGKPDYIVFPKKTTGIKTAWGVAPGQSIPASSFAYDAVTITVQKGGQRLEFTNEALRQAMRDVIKDHIYEAGLEWAEQLDTLAKTEMLGIQASSHTHSAGSNVSTVATKSILEITSVNGNTISAVDYYKGVIFFTGTEASTVSFTYARRPLENGNVLCVETARTITAWDLLAAKNKLVAKKRHPDYFILNDADLPGLLYDQKVKFLDASAYGSSEAILNGEIGKIFGMKVVTSVRAPEGVAIAIDSKRLGYDVIKEELTGHREDKWEVDSVWYHFWGRRAFGVVDDDSVAIVLNGKSGNYPATIT